MSNEIKVGDKVRVSKDAPKMYLRGFDHIFTGVESVVSEVEDDNAVIIFNTGHINSQITIPTKYLVKVDAEAKEAKYTKTKGDTLTFPIAFDLTDSYWDAYTADLAKEIAVKVANKYTDPKETAEYAVKVAKAVAEGLKRK